MNKKILILGGDLRQLKCAQSLIEKGYDVKLYGFSDSDGMEISKNPKEDIEKSDYIVLPLPVTYDEIYINAPMSDEKIPLKLVYENITEKTVVFGGMIKETTKESLITDKIYDYAKDEEFLIKNAMITTEGAFQIIFSETPISVLGSRFLITGYGRIGKTLAKVASAFGANVSVCARKNSDFAWIELNGYTLCKYRDLYDDIGSFDIIVNTVPCHIFDRKIISKISKNALFVDLASIPGGCDINDMKDAGIKAIHALSLPGKVAPFSSGKIISDIIINMTDEGL